MDVSIPPFMFTYAMAMVEEDGKMVPRVCRVLRVTGPISPQPSKRKENESKNARNYVMQFFFNYPATAKNKPSDAQDRLRMNKAGGHLIADSLGGLNSQENIVPFVHMGFNTSGAWSQLERKITACLNNSKRKDKKKVIMPVVLNTARFEVRPKYKAGLIPESASEMETLEYYIPTRIDGFVVFANASIWGTTRHVFFDLENSSAAMLSFPPNCGFGQPDAFDLTEHDTDDGH